MNRILLVAIMSIALSLTSLLAQSAPAILAKQVFAAESSFAASMARRDLKAFAALLSPEAVFFSDTAALRGKEAVVQGWQKFFAGPDAPFSWKPETIEVLSSGTLALSSGPVHDPSGKQVGTFNSVWRREAGGRWRVIFDKGCE